MVEKLVESKFINMLLYFYFQLMKLNYWIIWFCL